MDHQVNFELLSAQFNLERTLDYIQFRSTYINNFDFERINELAAQQLIKRTGSRSTSWKMMLGVLPNINDKEEWSKAIKEHRTRFQKLQDKHMRLNNQIHTQNPLASLNAINQTNEIFNMKEDRDVKILIKKDVERTMQEYKLFKNPVVQQKMEEILYIWAKEYPEFRYQQGMNEILAIIVICVTSELFNEHTVIPGLESDEDHSSDDNEDQSYDDGTKKLFKELHDVTGVWADIYAMYENLMNLGVKELYYKDINNGKNSLRQLQKQNIDDSFAHLDPLRHQTKDRSELNSINAQASPRSSNGDNQQAVIASKEDQQRQRKQKLLELNQEDAQKTALKKRSNKIFNNYLREIDPDLYKHILGIDVQPEIIFLKFLRCLLSREFHISSLIYVWDFIFAGIDEKGRIYLKEQKKAAASIVYMDDQYFLQHQDFMKNLDYVCLSMVQLQREKLIHADYLSCLKFTTNTQKLDCHTDVIKIADRIGKIIYDRLIKRNSVMQKNDFPMILEKEVAQFMLHHSLNQTQQEESNMNSDGEEVEGFEVRKCFKVREEDEEEEENSVEEDAQNLSQDRMKEVDEVEAQLQNNPIDDEADRLSNDIADELEISQDNLDQSGYNNNNELQSCEEAKGENGKQLFKLKDTKGKVVFDQNTKQRRFMSPFDQFLAEQQELFKKDTLRQNDEQNSVTLTTTASTQFDLKIGALNSMNSGSGSVSEEPISQQKQKVSLKPANKLAQVANIMQKDTMYKNAEDEVMLQRKQNLHELRSIRGYLTGVKTGQNAQIAAKFKRSQTTMSQSVFF